MTLAPKQSQGRLGKPRELEDLEVLTRSADSIICKQTSRTRSGALGKVRRGQVPEFYLSSPKWEVGRTPLPTSQSCWPTEPVLWKTFTAHKLKVLSYTNSRSLCALCHAHILQTHLLLVYDIITLLGENLLFVYFVFKGLN